MKVVTTNSAKSVASTASKLMMWLGTSLHWSQGIIILREQVYCILIQQTPLADAVPNACTILHSTASFIYLFPTRHYGCVDEGLKRMRYTFTYTSLAHYIPKVHCLSTLIQSTAIATIIRYKYL